VVTFRSYELQSGVGSQKVLLIRVATLAQPFPLLGRMQGHSTNMISVYILFLRPAQRSLCLSCPRWTGPDPVKVRRAIPRGLNLWNFSRQSCTFGYFRSFQLRALCCYHTHGRGLTDYKLGVAMTRITFSYLFFSFVPDIFVSAELCT
jgi:hypothetical protein